MKTSKLSKSVWSNCYWYSVVTQAINVISAMLYLTYFVLTNILPTIMAYGIHECHSRPSSEHNCKFIHRILRYYRVRIYQLCSTYLVLLRVIFFVFFISTYFQNVKQQIPTAMQRPTNKLTTATICERARDTPLCHSFQRQGRG